MKTLLVAFLLASGPAGANKPVPRSTMVDPTTETYDGPLPDRGALWCGTPSGARTGSRWRSPTTPRCAPVA
jgi:hypothetical protein